MNPDAMHRIRKKVPREHVPSAIAVYAALCEIARVKRDDTFPVTNRQITDATFLSRDTVLLRLKDLKSARVLKLIDAPNGGTHSYTLPYYTTGASD